MKKCLDCQNDNKYGPDQHSIMKCVTCPFCKKMVDAILSPEYIKCPKCGKTASISR